LAAIARTRYAQRDHNIGILQYLDRKHQPTTINRVWNGGVSDHPKTGRRCTGIPVHKLPSASRYPSGDMAITVLSHK